MSLNASFGSAVPTTNDVVPTFRSAEASRRGGLHDETIQDLLGSSAIGFTVSVWPSTVSVTTTFQDLRRQQPALRADVAS